jgi:hypothetical protein
MSGRPIVLTAVIERRQRNLPRFVAVPSDALKAWSLAGSTSVQVSFNGQEAAPRTIKKGGDGYWLISVTEKDCRSLGLDTGDKVKISLQAADSGLPHELAMLLNTSETARAAWDARTPAQQRKLRDEIAAVKQPGLRWRRARQALLGDGTATF